MIQYASDLHLEFFAQAPNFKSILRPVAPYLVLAGDIGQPDHNVFCQFIDYVSSNWKAVILIMGNHESYTNRAYRNWASKPPRTLAQTIDTLATLCMSYPNLHFLHAANPSAFFPDDALVFLGTTLWSYIPDEMLECAKEAMNDYKCIPVADSAGIHPLTPEESRTIHAHEKSVLEAQIVEWSSKDVSIIVVTHHMPSFSLVAPRYDGDPLNCCFASNCDSLMTMTPALKAWIYGHTHAASVQKVGDTLCAINARGYPKGGEVPGYSPEAVLFKPTTTIVRSAASAAIDENELVFL
jgi:predicted phosphodiesterase